MAQIIWKANLRFSLVSISVGLISAHEEESKVRFRELDPKDKTPIKQKKVNATTGDEVPNIVKGYEIEKDRYVLITDEEIESALPPSSRDIEIVQFVDRSEVPHIYLGSHYYLTPTSEQDAGAYFLLNRVLSNQRHGAVARMVMRNKQYLALILPYNGVLTLSTLHYNNEVRGPEVVGAKRIELSAEYTQVAEMIVDRMQSSWDARVYRDEFQSRILSIIQHKHEKGEVKKFTPPIPVAVGNSDLDLIALLQRSLDEIRAQEPKPRLRKIRPNRKRRVRKVSRTRV